mgnify:CR=1 FL=1
MGECLRVSAAQRHISGAPPPSLLLLPSFPASASRAPRAHLVPVAQRDWSLCRRERHVRGANAIVAGRRRVEVDIAARHLKLAGKSNSRSRRPTLDELDRILTFFVEAHRRDKRSLPMHAVVTFAVFSSRRQDEITRITWEDFHEGDMTQLVRDMKHPGQKKGNDVLCETPPEALRAMRLQPHRTGNVFPYNSDTISRRFTDACKFLEIDDLRFHDLRHEAVSRLFQMGRTIPQAAAVSGHRSWQSLQRYTHLRGTGDKFENWSGWQLLEKRAMASKKA